MKNQVTAFYNKTDKQQKLFIAYRKRLIERGKDELLKAMNHIVEKSVKHYLADFYVHDLEFIKENSDHPFLWMVHESGTHIIDLLADYFDDRDLDHWLEKDLFHAILINSGHDTTIYKAIYGQLKKINRNQAVIIIKKYEALAISRKEATEK